MWTASGHLARLAPPAQCQPGTLGHQDHQGRAPAPSPPDAARNPAAALAAADTAPDAAEAANSAYLLLSRAALVHACSPAAHDLLDLNAGSLRLDRQWLRAPRQPTVLEDCLVHAAVRGQAAAALHRPGRLPLTLRCLRLSPCAERAARLQLTLCDPERQALDPGLLQPMFDLTASEAAVACALAGGLSPAQVARRLGVQVNTVLAHVKRALAKTGTHRQAEMVSLLLRSAARVIVPHARHHELGAPCCIDANSLPGWARD